MIWNCLRWIETQFTPESGVSRALRVLAESAYCARQDDRQGKSRGTCGGQEVHGVVVEPATEFCSCSQEAVKEEAEDAGDPTDDEDGGASVEGPASRSGNRSGDDDSDGCSAQADGTICSGFYSAEV